ncbi:transmembrane protein 245-like isoform X2 [Liolophura sinensis]|uniref:transmembrane protein 245-like isoform X2 n=1 Tax=Liolophura sinensis TaxID=3198878 RepID=UPI00315876CE
MASPSSQEQFRPLDNIYQILPQGHEKALKQAFYNTLAILFVIVACAAGIAVYFILESFVRPLLWAVLCGTFLYPFKRSLTSTLRRWLTGLNDSGTPFALGFVLLPVTVVDQTSEGLRKAILKNLKLVLGICAGVPALYLLYHFGPLRKIFCVCQFCYNFVYGLLGYFSSLWIWTLVIAYLLLVIFYWTPETSKTVKYLGIPVWGTLMLHVSCLAGPLRLALLTVLIGLVVLGYMSEKGSPEIAVAITQAVEPNEPDPPRPWLSYWPLSAIVPSKSETVTEQAADPHEAGSSVGTVPRPTSAPARVEEVRAPRVSPAVSSLRSPGSSSTDTRDKSKRQDLTLDVMEKKDRSLSDKCFIALFYGIVLLKLWTHVWILQLLLPLPFFVMLVKKLGSQFCEGGLLGDKVKHLRETLRSWVETRQEVLAPKPVKGFFKLVMSCDRKVISILEQSLDTATSILLILTLVVGTLLFMIFFAVQVHQESIQMVTLTSNVLNNSLPPDMTQWLPNRDNMHKAMDSMVGNAYMYGRDWISTRVRESGDGVNNTKLEKQVLELWDRLYMNWFAKNSTALKRRRGFSTSPSIENLTSVWEAVSSNGLAVGGAVDFVKANIGTLMSVFESVWTVLKGNLSLFFSSLTAVLSMVFGGGTAVLNFVISAVIFLTTIFYLLASSGDKYKPLEVFTTISPSGQRFAQAVEEAISGVFMASLKMALFYGLYTWFTHSAFGVSVVFIPAALAAIFAAIPFLGTYWAAIPGVLELWLVHREGVLAIILFVAQMLPTYVVDTAIYSEIQGGHPYMTGLAIAGGMFCMGLEGAIVGPILLCCLIVTMNVYGSFLKPDSAASTPSGDWVFWWKSRSVSSDDQLRLHVAHS